MNALSKRKYAIFANAAYKYPGTKEYLKQNSETQGFKYRGRFSGKYTTVATKGSELVLALRGTDPMDGTDLIADGLLSFDLTSFSYRYKQAVFILEKILLKFPNMKVTVVGHSLGGVLAARLFDKYSRVVKGVFYNPAPLKSITESSLVTLFNNWVRTKKKGGYVFLVALDPISAGNRNNSFYKVEQQDWNPVKGKPHTMAQFL